VFTYLTLLNGARAGYSFILLDEEENLIGRGLDCRVVLNDPLSSRVHAIIERREGSWFIRDAGSRNGTFVNGQKADEAPCQDRNHRVFV
jgi:pSer/pThr/pTyr-binding forkhead associated (FHA) protein